MPSPLIPATLAFAADGTPYSEAYGDVYHSAGGGPAQARYVFLQGNGLPERWRGRRAFTILETGFGFGMSFLAAWRAWREDPARCERLHFVSVEKHPFAAPHLSFLWEKNGEFENESRQLLARWPMLVPGMHRLEFEDGNVVLSLFFGDIAEGLPQLQLAADAIFLDGFAPAKNPAMWSPPLLRHLGRLSAPGATLATWSVASPVREALEGAGFAVEKDKGFATKKEMLRGRLVPRKKTAPEKKSPRSAIVIGAGVAGAAVSERLASRGWQVALIERRGAPAAEASGNPAAVFHPIVSPDDSLFARCTRAAFLFLLERWKNLGGLEWRRCGVLQLARDARGTGLAEARARIARLPGALRGIRRSEGRPLVSRGRLGQAAQPRAGAASEVRGKMDLKLHHEVSFLEFKNGNWHASSADGNAIASAPIVVLANAADALRLAPQAGVRLQRVRGQLTLVPAIEGLNHVILRGGMVLPGIDGLSVVGASYDVGDEDAQLRADSHAGNLARLEQMLPGATRGLDATKLDGRVAFRAVMPDRLPITGPICDEAAADLRCVRLWFAWLAVGRSGGEILASLLEGEPLPVERKLAAAMDPGRFALRAARRNAGPRG